MKYLLIMLAKDGSMVRQVLGSIKDAQSLGDLMLMSTSILAYDVFQISPGPRKYIKPFTISPFHRNVSDH